MCIRDRAVVVRSLLSRNLRASLHWPVILPSAGLLLMGVIALSGIDLRIGGIWIGDWHLRQLFGIAIGLAAAFVVLLVPYKTWVRHAYLLYAVNIGLLLLVMVIGSTAMGGQRWLSIGGFNFQPSELMKVTLVLTLARFIRFRSSYKTFRGLGTPFLLTLFPMALILQQPDLGTALLCMPLLFATLFVAGARARHLALILFLGASAIVPLYHQLEPYQRRRVDGFLAQLPLVKREPKTDQEREEAAQLQREINYQVENSKMAVGSGGVIGVGLGHGEDEALYWVPERHTDFIFTAVCNEMGFLGALVTLALFAWLLMSILAVATRQRDPAGRLICVGVFTLFASQAFVKMAMTVGLVPITGMTLPFVSYGRSSVVVSILASALVCNVAGRPSYEFGRGDFD